MELGITDSHIELNAKYVVNLLKNSLSTNLLMEPFLLIGRTPLRWFRIRFFIMFFEANQCTNALAKLVKWETCFVIHVNPLAIKLWWKHNPPLTKIKNKNKNKNLASLTIMHLFSCSWIHYWVSNLVISISLWIFLIKRRFYYVVYHITALHTEK